MRYRVKGAKTIYETMDIEAPSEIEARKIFIREHRGYFDIDSSLIDICYKCKSYFSMSHNHRTEESCNKGYYNDCEAGYRRTVNSCNDFVDKKKKYETIVSDLDPYGEEKWEK